MWPGIALSDVPLHCGAMNPPKWFWVVTAVCMVLLTLLVGIRQVTAAESSRYQIIPGRDSSADGLFDSHTRTLCYIDSDGSSYCEDFVGLRIQQHPVVSGRSSASRQ